MAQRRYANVPKQDKVRRMYEEDYYTAQTDDLLRRARKAHHRAQKLLQEVEATLHD